MRTSRLGSTRTLTGQPSPARSPTHLLRFGPRSRGASRPRLPSGPNARVTRKPSPSCSRTESFAWKTSSSAAPSIRNQLILPRRSKRYSRGRRQLSSPTRCPRASASGTSRSRPRTWIAWGEPTPKELGSSSTRSPETSSSARAPNPPAAPKPPSPPTNTSSSSLTTWSWSRG